MTATPGVGKAFIGNLFGKKTGFSFLTLADLVKKEALHEGFDRRAKSYIINEPAVRKRLERSLKAHREKGIVVETHSMGSILHKTRGIVAVVLRLDPVLLAKQIGRASCRERV